MKTLTVVCPVYEEEAVILAFHEELRRGLGAIEDRWSWSVIYVVDRGSDATLLLLRELARRDPAVRVLALASHFGQQASLVAGLDHCDSDAVVMMDSDLQHPPAVVPQLVAAHEAGYDVVYTVREDTPGLPLAKRLSARLYYRLLNTVSETEVHQGAADFRLVSRRVVEVFQREVRERGLFLRGLFGWVGFPSTAVRFRVRPRAAGRSKYSLPRMFRFGLTGVVAMSRAPLRAALGAGLVLVALGLVAGIGAGLAALRWGGSWPLWLLAGGGFALVSGVQLLFLGVLGEYLGAVLDEVRGRPRYIVEERINLAGSPSSAGDAARREADVEALPGVRS
jgi:polyisoprenyl-phosphate glycosyltransferase